MDRYRADSIVSRWAFPTERFRDIGGLEERPIIESPFGSVVRDIDGKEYLDFQFGQMGEALGHQHPRIVRRITETLGSLMHASNAMVHVPGCASTSASGGCCEYLCSGPCSWSPAVMPSRRRSISRARRPARTPTTGDSIRTQQRHRDELRGTHGVRLATAGSHLC
jgi:hypothetical protein